MLSIPMACLAKIHLAAKEHLHNSHHTSRLGGKITTGIGEILKNCLGERISVLPNGIGGSDKVRTLQEDVLNRILDDSTNKKNRLAFARRFRLLKIPKQTIPLVDSNMRESCFRQKI